MNSTPEVYLVDDNQPFRRSLAFLLQSSGIEVREFNAASTLLEHLKLPETMNVSGCAISDVCMPGMSGLELLENIKRRHYEVPVIFISAHADVALAVEAMRQGAVDFIEKPFAVEMLLRAIRLAMSSHTPRSQPGATLLRGRRDSRLAALTRREHQVLELVVAGKFNKVIADILRISIKTVELHRSSLMAKLGVQTLPDLVKVSLGYELPAPDRLEHPHREDPN
jgi:two-component system response regulator FixJ